MSKNQKLIAGIGGTGCIRIAIKLASGTVDMIARSDSMTP